MPKKLRSYWWLRFDADREAEGPFNSVREAREAFRETADELARYGQDIEATLHIADSQEDIEDYPEFTLSRGPRGGVVTARA